MASWAVASVAVPCLDGGAQAVIRPSAAGSPARASWSATGGAEKTTLHATKRIAEADSVLPADPGAPSTRTVIITPGGAGSSGTEPAGFGAQDLQGGQGAAAADPHAGPGDQR